MAALGVGRELDERAVVPNYRLLVARPHRPCRWWVIETVLGSGLVPEQEGLPARVRTARLRLGLTQQELAQRAGVDEQTVRNAETGKLLPSGISTQRLRAILGDHSLTSPTRATIGKPRIAAAD